jgi:hypothetical protein
MVKKFKKRAAPIMFQEREGMNFGEGVGVADHTQNRNANNVGEVMTNPVCYSRVGKVGAVLEQAGGSMFGMRQGIKPDFAVPLTGRYSCSNQVNSWAHLGISWVSGSRHISSRLLA